MEGVADKRDTTTMLVVQFVSDAFVG